MQAPRVRHASERQSRRCHAAREVAEPRRRRQETRRADGGVEHREATCDHRIERGSASVCMMSAVAGYSGTPLAKKLGIKDGSRVFLANAPDNYARMVAPLPAGVRMVGTID